MSVGRNAFKLAFEISPIILTGGIAAQAGGMIPIISLTEAANFVTGLLSGGDALTLDDFFAHYRPIPGGSLIEQDIGKYPFANQAVAANAVITRELHVSMLMVCPVRKPLGYAAKLATITALQSTLTLHNTTGGTYTIATPSFFYTNCVMKSFRDAADQNSAQAQNAFILEFEKPLLTLEQAATAEGALFNKLTSGTEITGDPSWTNYAPLVGIPSSLIPSSLISAASQPFGAGSALAATFG